MSRPEHKSLGNQVDNNVNKIDSQIVLSTQQRGVGFVTEIEKEMHRQEIF